MGSAAPGFEECYLKVGDNLMHVRSGGVAGALPTVVLEAGGGSTLPVWRAVEPGLAPHTRVLSYERAGIGGTLGKDKSVSAEAVARRLDGLLEAACTQIPVVLAGHSLGGLYARYFASTRRQQVCGLVLLDASPEDMVTPRGHRWKPWLILWTMHILARLRLFMPLVTYLRPGVGIEQLRHEMALVRRAQFVRTVIKETGTRVGIQTEVAAVPLAALASLPVLTISAGSGLPRDMLDMMRRSHDKLAAAGRPPYSRHHRVEGATHMSLLTDAQHGATVAELILKFSRQITPQSAAAA